MSDPDTLGPEFELSVLRTTPESSTRSVFRQTFVSLGTHADVRLSGDGVGRIHAILEPDDGGVVVVSTGGGELALLVRGVPETRARLENGASFSIGPHVLAVESRRLDVAERLTHVATSLIHGAWVERPAALVACQSGGWPEFVRRVAPEAPRLFGRWDHQRCVEVASEALTGPREFEIELVPIWVCSSEDGENDEWIAAHAVVPVGRAGGPHREQVSVGTPSIVEVGPYIGHEDASPRLEQRMRCLIRRWSAATVVDLQRYAPEIPMRLRAGRFGVLDLDVDELITARSEAGAALPRPTDVVSEFCTRVRPRVVVPGDLADALASLDLVPDDAGSP